MLRILRRREPNYEVTALGQCFESVLAILVDRGLLVRAAAIVDQVLDRLVVAERCGDLRRCEQIDGSERQRFDIRGRNQVDFAASDQSSIGLRDSPDQSENFGLRFQRPLPGSTSLTLRSLGTRRRGVLDVAFTGRDRQQKRERRNQTKSSLHMHGEMINDSGRRFKCRAAQDHVVRVKALL
jgi:hypothetical protein